jgi:hypothetical protein
VDWAIVKPFAYISTIPKTMLHSVSTTHTNPPPPPPPPPGGGGGGGEVKPPPPTGLF